MSDYEYNGPRVPRTRNSEQVLRQRLAVHVEAIARRRFHEAVQKWAAADSGQYPELVQFQREAGAEVEVLCCGLGRWGAVDPDEVLGSLWDY